MLDFIERHQKILLIVMSSIIIAMLVILFVVSRGEKEPSTDIVDNQPDYSFLKVGLSKEDEYLLLLGKIVTEEYGTYSKDDYRSLYDVQNQSTSNFSAHVQSLIDSISNSPAIATVTDPETIELADKQQNSATVTMDATSVRDGKSQPIKVAVKLVRENNFWLVENIEFNNE